MSHKQLIMLNIKYSIQWIALSSFWHRLIWSVEWLIAATRVFIIRERCDTVVCLRGNSREYSAVSVDHVTSHHIISHHIISHTWVPPGVHDEDVWCHREVQGHTPCLQRNQKHLMQVQKYVDRYFQYWNRLKRRVEQVGDNRRGEGRGGERGSCSRLWNTKAAVKLSNCVAKIVRLIPWLQDPLWNSWWPDQGSVTMYCLLKYHKKDQRRGGATQRPRHNIKKDFTQRVIFHAASFYIIMLHLNEPRDATYGFN